MEHMVVTEGLISIAEYDLNGHSFLVVRRDGTSRRATHYRLDGGLYLALSGHRATAADFLPGLLARLEKVSPPEAAHSVRYRTPFLPVDVTYGMVSGFGLAHRNKVPTGTLDASGRATGYPSWFFKGFAHALKTDGEPLRVSKVAHVVCEEAEIVLVYHVGSEGHPVYLGFTFGNDMTDIGQIRNNSLHMPYGKLSDSAIHHFLFLDEPPERADGRVRIARQGETVWIGHVTNGCAMLAYEVRDMMSKLWIHHSLLVPGMVHYVYIGADRNSTDHGFLMRNGDVIDINFDAFGVHLSNPIVLGEGA
jgi:hypothetical protein